MITLNNFYQSKEWCKFRQAVIMSRLTKEGFTICEYCNKPIIKSYDIIAHHIEALTEENVNDVMIALNDKNIQLVHHVCHNKIHNKLGNKEQKVYLVYGSPFAGKTSYVNSVKDSGDLIIDMDSIWQCVSGEERYNKDGRLKSCVFSVRDALIECVKYRKGKWNNAYVVGGYPLVGERERLVKSLGAEEIYIDAEKDECFKRLENCLDARKDNKADWKKFIDDWWNKFTPPH